jgi:hypothetical protein
VRVKLTIASYFSIARIVERELFSDAGGEGHRRFAVPPVAADEDAHATCAMRDARCAMRLVPQQIEVLSKHVD